MNIKTIASTLLAAIMGFVLAMPATALADRGDRDHRQGYSHYDNDRHGHHREHRRHAKRHRDHHSGGHGKRHWKKHRHHSKRHHHYDRHHYGHNRHYYHGYDDDDDEKLLFGLILGGILGYALNESQYDDDDYFYDNAYGSGTASGADTYRHNDGTCLQEREYQTTVMVGGREVPAYGTACLQPDGSWKRSPARVASY